MYNIERTHNEGCVIGLEKEKEILKDRLMLEAEMYSLRAVLEVSMSLKEKTLSCLEKIEKISQN